MPHAAGHAAVGEHLRVILTRRCRAGVAWLGGGLGLGLGIGIGIGLELGLGLGLGVRVRGRVSNPNPNPSPDPKQVSLVAGESWGAMLPLPDEGGDAEGARGA